MGREYQGDIKGRFWLGKQDSDDASFFGAEEEGIYDEEHEEEIGTFYSFFPRHEPRIIHGISECEDHLGSWCEQLDEFFSTKEFLNDDHLAKEIGASLSDIKEALTWYARLMLGRQILECLRERGRCLFKVLD